MGKFIFYFTALISLTIGCKRFPELGKGYQLGYNGMNDVSIVKCLKKGDAPTILISGHILDYTFDSIFVLAAERPRDSVPGIETMSQSKYQEAFEKSTFLQYWIIDKTRECVFNEQTKTYSNVYGPYKPKVYLTKRKELGVPDRLKLKTE